MDCRGYSLHPVPRNPTFDVIGLSSPPREQTTTLDEGGHPICLIAPPSFYYKG